MNTKLTLTIEAEVNEKAKEFAKSKNRSLSNIIENYLKAITEKQETSILEEPSTPYVESLRGSFTEPAETDYKKEKANRLTSLKKLS